MAGGFDSAAIIISPVTLNGLKLQRVLNNEPKLTHIFGLADVVAALDVAYDLVLLRLAAREWNPASLARTHRRRRAVEIHVAVPAEKTQCSVNIFLPGLGNRWLKCYNIAPTWSIILYRVTHQVGPNLLLTSKQMLRFSICS